MWNQPFSPDIFEDDPFDRFTKAGGITSGKGDWAWLQHTIAVMNDGGRAAVVLDTGAVTRGSGSKNEDKERNIRKWFVDHDYVEGVILLPENLFYNTGSAGIIVVLNKRKPAVRKDKIVLLNASKRFKKGRPKNYLVESELQELADLFRSGDPIDGELEIITTAEARNADYNLSPSRWVSQLDEANHRTLKEIRTDLAALDEREAEVNDVLYRMLEKLRGDPDKDTEIGRMTESWTLRRLDECADVISTRMAYSELEGRGPSTESDAVRVLGIKVSDMNRPGNEVELLGTALEVDVDLEVAKRQCAAPGTIIFQSEALLSQPTRSGLPRPGLCSIPTLSVSVRVLVLTSGSSFTGSRPSTYARSPSLVRRHSSTRRTSTRS